MIKLVETQILSSGLRGSRQVWIQESRENKHKRCILFLDAELYIERVRAPEIIESIWEAGDVPPADCLYLSAGRAEDRHMDFVCDEGFSRFLALDFLTWIEAVLGPRDEFLLCGLSLSGLA